MNKRIFKYSAMQSGKSAQLIALYYTAKSQHKELISIVPKFDTRTKQGYISSRNGESIKADITTSDNIDIFRDRLENQILLKPSLKYVIIDECQFLSKEQVKLILDAIDINYEEVTIIFTGLLKDYQNKVFPTSLYILEQADTLEEIKSSCQYCVRKATCSLRLNNGKPIYNDPQGTNVLGDSNYVAVCHYHYKHPKISNKKNKTTYPFWNEV